MSIIKDVRVGTKANVTLEAIREIGAAIEAGSADGGLATWSIQDRMVIAAEAKYIKDMVKGGTA